MSLRRLRRWTALWLLVGCIGVAPGPVLAGSAYQMAVGHQNGPTYGLGVGIASLIKVKVLPATGTDLDTMITSSNAASLERLRQGAADFALAELEQGRAPHVPEIQAVATLRRHGTVSTTLLARADMDDDVVYEIIKAIFDDLPFLASIEPTVAEMSLDHALLGLEVPLHAGAKRYFADRWVTEPAVPLAAATGASSAGPGQAEAAAPAPDGAAVIDADQPGDSETDDRKADAWSFVVYFGFDQASLDDQGLRTVQEAIAFANTLANPAILVAGYTDAVGDPDYNYLLAERRAKAVVAILNDADLRYGRLDVELFGERELPQVTLDGVVSANNRRVELFIEEPVPPLPPLPLADNAAVLGGGRGGPAEPAPELKSAPELKPAAELEPASSPALSAERRRQIPTASQPPPYKSTM